MVPTNYKYNIVDKIVDDHRNLTILDRKVEKVLNVAKKDGTEHKKGENFYLNVIKYKIACNNCGFDGEIFYRKGKKYNEYWVQQGNLANQKSGCPICGRKNSLITVSNINSIVANDNTKWMIPYFQGEYDEAKMYTPGSNEKKYFICPSCGRVKDKQMCINTLFQRKHLPCICGDGISYPNKYGFELFNNQLKDQINNFHREYQPEWAKPYYYDFYFERNNNKYICEFDGGLGHGKEMHRLSAKSLEESVKIDTIKDKMATDHNIEIIRIDTSVSDSNYILKNILNSELSKIFDMSVVDFIKCDEFACSNLVKTICLDYENLDISLTELSKKYFLSLQTVIIYIKHGRNIGWCTREPDKHSPVNIKKVKMIFDNGNYEIFESAAELERISYERFGVKLYQNAIRAVCSGSRRHYKGFKNFEYVIDGEVMT